MRVGYVVGLAVHAPEDVTDLVGSADGHAAAEVDVRPAYVVRAVGALAAGVPGVVHEKQRQVGSAQEVPLVALRT